MSNENLHNESEFRRFLLGEMEENERTEFEGQFILDEEVFENLRVAEDELIEEYVRGKLSVSEISGFETNFLTTQKRRERVEFTRQMLSKIKEIGAVAEVKKTASVVENPSFFEAVLDFFKQPKFAMGTAFAILLLLFGGWFLLKKPNQPIDIVQITPTPTPQISVSPTPAIVENTNKQVNQNSQSPKVEPTANKTLSNSNLQKPLQTPANPVITTLALFTGGVRSQGKTNELNLTKETTAANLQLNLESQDYKNYRAEIVDQNGSVIYRSGILKAQSSKLNAFVSAQKLKRGDYIIKVYGKNTKNEDESVADFQFRVNQK